jgi:CRISPR-associated protein Cas6
MPMIDLSFPVLGTSLPTDHGYELYAALSRVLPALHDGELPSRIAPVRGTYGGDGLLQLDRRYSRLRIRLALEAIPQVLPLAGKALEVGGHRVRLGVPQLSALVPAPALAARLVTIRVAHVERAPEPTEFLDAARRRLDAMGIGGEAGIPMVEIGPHAGTPRRRILRIRQRKVVGFALRAKPSPRKPARPSSSASTAPMPSRRRRFFMPMPTAFRTPRSLRWPIACSSLSGRFQR